MQQRKPLSSNELVRMNNLFRNFMDSEYPGGSGNTEGAFYEYDMLTAFEAGYSNALGEIANHDV